VTIFQGFRNLAADLVRFWGEPVRAEPLAAFRIALGINLLLNLFVTILPVLDVLVEPDGLCPAPAVDSYLQRRGQFSLLRGPINLPVLETCLPRSWSQAWAQWGATPQAAYTLVWAYAGALVFLVAGFYTRVAVVVCWALDVSLHGRLAWVMNGGDDVGRMALFYLMFSRCEAVWSLDSLRRRQRGAKVPLVPAWPLRLMQIQLCAVYFFSGLVKLGNTILTPSWYTCDWINGEAIYWVLNDIALNRWPFAWTPVPLWACRLLTWLTMAFELGFPFGIWFRSTRPWFLLTGLFFHLGILVQLEIAWFSQYMLCWYLLFFSGESLKRFLGRWPVFYWSKCHESITSTAQQSQPGLLRSHCPQL
jgi:hypothetical protein